MNKHTINLKVPEEFNTRKSKFDKSWKDIIQIGLQTLEESNTSKVSPNKVAIEKDITQAIKHLKAAWDTIKTL